MIVVVVVVVVVVVFFSFLLYRCCCGRSNEVVPDPPPTSAKPVGNPLRLLARILARVPLHILQAPMKHDCKLTPVAPVAPIFILLPLPLATNKRLGKVLRLMHNCSRLATCGSAVCFIALCTFALQAVLLLLLLATALHATCA